MSKNKKGSHFKVDFLEFVDSDNLAIMNRNDLVEYMKFRIFVVLIKFRL